MKKKIFPYVEIIVFFLILDCINFLFLDENLGFLRWDFSPYWIIIIFIAARYGFIPSIVVGVVACFHILWFTFERIPSKTEFEIYLESLEFFLPLAMIVISTFLGAFRQKQIAKFVETKEGLAEKLEEVKLLRKDREALHKEKEVIEKRIVGESSTIQTLYQSAKRLESKNEDEIFSGCLEILTESLQVEKSSLYMKEGNYFVLKAHVGWDPGMPVEGKCIFDKSVMSLAIEENRALTIKELLGLKTFEPFLKETSQVVAMFPLTNKKGEAIGVVNIEKISFLAFNRPNLKLIELIIKWTSEVLVDKSLLDSLHSKVIKDEKYNIHNFFYFFKLLKEQHLLSKSFSYFFTFTIIKMERYGFYNNETQEFLKECYISYMKRYVSKTDKVFHYKFDGTFCLISPLRTGKEVQECLEKLNREFIETVQKTLQEVSPPSIKFSIIEYDPSFTDYEEMLKKGAKECQLPS